MSKYAKIEEGLVTNVILCEDSEISSQTGNYIKVTELTRSAVVGGTYDEDSNKFIALKPYSSWTLSEDLVWVSPAGEEPSDGDYEWDEENLNWNKLTPGNLKPSENHTWDPELEEWILP